MDGDYKKALGRIQSIYQKLSNDSNQDHTGAWLLLFQEFNRRMAYWAKLINKDASGYGVWIDIAYEIDNTWSIEPEMTNELDFMLKNISKYSSFLKFYLNWEKHKKKIASRGLNVELEPYEPIVLFFELGKGWIHNEGTGYYEIGKDRIRRPKIENLYNKSQFIALDIDSLALADSEYNLDRDIFYRKYGLG